MSSATPHPDSELRELTEDIQNIVNTSMGHYDAIQKVAAYVAARDRRLELAGRLDEMKTLEKTTDDCIDYETYDIWIRGRIDALKAELDALGSTERRPGDSPADPYIHCKQCGGIATDVDELRQHIKQKHSPADAELDSHLVIYKDGEVIKDQTTCGKCGLNHLPPMTHDLHVALIEEFKEAQTCDHCIYGGYSPHKTIGVALSLWEHRAVVAAVLHDFKQLRATPEIDWIDEVDDRIHKLEAQLTIQTDEGGEHE